VKVDIAIATYRRPRGLARLLHALDRLRSPGASPRLGGLVGVEREEYRVVHGA